MSWGSRDHDESVIFVCGGAAAHRRRVTVCYGRCGEESDFTQRRRVIVAYEASPYYPPTSTCCHCGDSWSEGLHPRPFSPGWRERSKARAKILWEQASVGSVDRDEEFYVIPDDRQPA